MKRSILLAALAAAGLCCWAAPVPAAEGQQGPRNEQPGLSNEQFVHTASAAGMAEVNLSRVAERLGASPAVHRFAERMIADHTKANEELLQLANEKHWRVAPSMDVKHTELENRLLQMRGQQFDQAYAQAMLKDHQQAVALFQNEAKNGKDEQLRAWAAKTLPTLQHHLQMAEKLAGSETGQGSAETSTGPGTSPR